MSSSFRAEIPMTIITAELLVHDEHVNKDMFYGYEEVSDFVRSNLKKFKWVDEDYLKKFDEELSSHEIVNEDAISDALWACGGEFSLYVEFEWNHSLVVDVDVEGKTLTLVKE